MAVCADVVSYVITNEAVLPETEIENCCVVLLCCTVVLYCRVVLLCCTAMLYCYVVHLRKQRKQ